MEECGWCKFRLMKLGRIARVRISNVDKIIDADEQPVQLCNYVNVYYNDRITDKTLLSLGSATHIEVEKFGILENDVLITKDSESSDDIAVPALVDSSASGIVCGYHLAILRPDQSLIRGDFLFWCLLARPVIDSFSIGAKGVTRFGLTLNGIETVHIPAPPLDSQKAIANFLDRETARIDQLIAKKERMVARLLEREISLIWTQVIGRDLTNGSMVDSGIGWLGQLPEHWSAVRIKTMARMESGHTPSRSVEDYWANPTIPWVSLADSAQLRRVDTINETVNMISEAGLAGSSARILPAGTVVFTRDATVGLAAILGREMAVSQHLVGWVCGPRLDPRYLLHVIYAMQQELNRLTWGSTIKTIGMPDLLNLSCPLPPLDEQRRIVERLEQGLTSSRRLRLQLARSIELLREFRSALITAAVTGQIDVATWRRRGDVERRLGTLACDDDVAHAGSAPDA